MSKLILNNTQARTKALEALELISTVVSSTLGPSGTPVLIEKLSEYSDKPVPTISKDGITVLRSLKFEDPIKNAVLNLCVQSAANTLKNAGDGTSSTILLAYYIAKVITENFSKYNNPQSFTRKINKQIKEIIDFIKPLAVKNNESLAESIALTSSNQDTEITNIVLKAVKESNIFGTVILERSVSQSENYVLFKQDGISSGKGYNQFSQLSHSVNNKTLSKLSYSLENAYILLYDGELQFTESQFSHIINQISSEQKEPMNIVIMAYEISQQVANTCCEINLKKKDRFKLWCSTIRQTGEQNSNWNKMYDLAAFSGARVINFSDLIEDEETKKRTFSIKDLGRCKEVIVTPEKTIFCGKSDKNTIIERAIQNENSIKNAGTEYDKEMIKIRNAELVNGLTKIIIGGGHNSNIQERADRVDDALKAVQAYYKEGALPGCGATYIYIANNFQNIYPELREAFFSIHNKIMNNYGITPECDFNINETVKISDDNIIKGNFIDLQIADSFDSIKSVLENACELATIISTLGGASLSDNLNKLEEMEMVKSLLPH